MPQTPLPLGGGITALVTAEHRFGSDAVLLADFARPRRRDTVCDLGTGCGILPLLWCRRDPPAHIDAVELQPEAAVLAAEAVRLNHLEDRITVHCADLRRLEGLAAGRYDRVTCNPPYFPRGSGRTCAPAADGARTLARHESASFVFADAVAAAARLLKNGGVLVFCHRPEYLAERLAELRAGGLEPKRLRFVQQRADNAPWLFLCEARKGGHPGLSVLPVLVRMDGSQESAAMREIYDV